MCVSAWVSTPPVTSRVSAPRSWACRLLPHEHGRTGKGMAPPAGTGGQSTSGTPRSGSYQVTVVPARRVARPPVGPRPTIQAQDTQRTRSADREGQAGAGGRTRPASLSTVVDHQRTILWISTPTPTPFLRKCYRASWQLPGPDFHRQATTSLRTPRNTMALRHGVTSRSAGRTRKPHCAVGHSGRGRSVAAGSSGKCALALVADIKECGIGLISFQAMSEGANVGSGQGTHDSVVLGKVDENVVFQETLLVCGR